MPILLEKLTVEDIFYNGLLKYDYKWFVTLIVRPLIFRKICTWNSKPMIIVVCILRFQIGKWSLKKKPFIYRHSIYETYHLFFLLFLSVHKPLMIMRECKSNQWAVVKRCNNLDFSSWIYIYMFKSLCISIFCTSMQLVLVRWYQIMRIYFMKRCTIYLWIDAKFFHVIYTIRNFVYKKYEGWYDTQILSILMGYRCWF